MLDGLFAKLLAMGITAGAIAGNADEIELFYQELRAQTQAVVSGMDMRSITMMLDYEYIRKGRYPAEGQFEAWMQKSFKENEFRELALDAWGNPFVYTTGEDRKTFLLVSAGPDGRIETDDDIISTGP
jgi:general secretion pathway protein G